MSPRKRGSKMTDAHKAALAEGREQGRAVRLYLEALETNRPKRGRKRTPETISKRLGRIEQDIATADPLTRLHLIQERQDLQAQLAATQNGGESLDVLQAGFVKAAKAYSERKGISYGAWREVGVPAPVLREAGISRSV